MATPLMIEIGLWYHTRVGDYGRDDGRFNAPAVQDAFRMFVNRGLLRKPEIVVEQEYEPTEALQVWCEALCDVRWPIQVWIIPKSTHPKDSIDGTRS